jgi:hypothetical protein
VIEIGPFTSRVEAVAAEKAFATGDRKGHNHAIPDLKVFHLGTDLDDLAHILMAKDIAFAAVEGRSMIVGAFALAAYSWVVCVLLKKFLLSSWTATMAVSGSSLRLVYPRPGFNSHDRSVQALRHKLRDHLTLSRNVLATASLCILT